MNMRALVYHSPQNISVEDVKVPEVGEKDVLIKIKYCGVCGTDIHIYNGDGGAFEVTPPLIMGHEFSGTVEQVGSQVKKVNIGDVVTVDPNNMCGECYYCKNAMEQFCENVIGIGTTFDGGFAQYIVVTEKQVFKFKEGMDALTAAMTEPVSCCLHGIDLCNIKLGDEVLVIGGGPIGLMMLQMAKMAGASKIILSEPVEEKRELALKLGADITINPLEEDIEAVIKANCKNINAVIECVGKVHTIDSAIKCAGKGATVMMFGLTGPDEALHVKPDIVFKKELKLTSSFINPYTFERSIAILESGKLNVRDTITDIVELEECVKVFEDDKYRRSGKVVIKLND
ncbi:zinc-dependent alcohol dehydrogenase family protein [Cellulosilyticum sp. I15G10I2]|uniref:zinc-dependent alcohol dehydrogenase family protein n=1 Tax=Cellulosilyticum sp. I15G10I2 TaxID=1892843 RepID=UPI000B180F2A|nr:zinc-dependent alcohol dehydrogenase family protein [Cellulosilyticum sp. I15G10I2]